MAVKGGQLRYLLLALLLAGFVMTFSYMLSVSSAILAGTSSATAQRLQQRLLEREQQLSHLLRRDTAGDGNLAEGGGKAATAEANAAPRAGREEEGRAAAAAAAALQAQRRDERDEALGSLDVGKAVESLKSSTAASSWNGTKLHEVVSASNDTLLRELLFRRCTRYWLDRRREWPEKAFEPTDRYVTFTPWPGGFNNIRMTLEMAYGFAWATNRTLVLPPEQNMYLRGKSSLTSYFDFEHMKRGLPVITYEEFYDRVHFERHQKESSASSSKHMHMERYYEGLKTLEGGVYDTSQKWGKRFSGHMVYCVPDCPTSPGTDSHKLREGASPDPAVSAKAKAERAWFSKGWGSLKKFETKDPELEAARVVHFPKNLLGHFYVFLYFRDPKMNSRLKRLIRDHIHYREDIVERAERIINKLGDFDFSCLHVRRNEFQFKEIWTDAETIVANTRDLFRPGEMIYISTDELSNDKEKKRKWSDPKAIVTVAKHTWFEPMKEAWGRDRVVFLSDFFDDLLAHDTPGMWLGCIESIVCTRARVFVGTRKSTFSGHIQRMRGYMADVGQTLILDAQTKYPEDYQGWFKGPEWVHLHSAYGGGHPYWGREYKDVWEGVEDVLG